jgi:hypothetical protein
MTAVVAQLHNVHGRVGKRELMGPRGRGGRRRVVAACLAAHLDLFSYQAAREASGAAGLPEQGQQLAQRPRVGASNQELERQV